MHIKAERSGNANAAKQISYWMCCHFAGAPMLSLRNSISLMFSSKWGTLPPPHSTSLQTLRRKRYACLLHCLQKKMPENPVLHCPYAGHTQMGKRSSFRLNIRRPRRSQRHQKKERSWRRMKHRKKNCSRTCASCKQLCLCSMQC